MRSAICIANTENGLFYLPPEGSQDIFLEQNGRFYFLLEGNQVASQEEKDYLPLEGSLDVLPAQRMDEVLVDDSEDDDEDVDVVNAEESVDSFDSVHC